MTKIRCNSETKEGIVENDNRTTWRYAEKELNGGSLAMLKPGDGIELTDTDDNVFATGEVQWVKFTTFGAFTEEDQKYHKQYLSTHECMTRLKRIYGATHIDMSTEIIVIRFSIGKFIECEV